MWKWMIKTHFVLLDTNKMCIFFFFENFLSNTMYHIVLTAYCFYSSPDDPCFYLSTPFRVLNSFPLQCKYWIASLGGLAAAPPPPPPETFFAGIAMIGQIHAFFQTFLIVDTPWTTQLNYMTYKLCAIELNVIYLELLNW